MAKILKSYYVENSYGCFQLVQDEDVFLVGWEALSSVDNPDWGYSVHCFSTLEEAKTAFDRQYSIDKSWGQAI
jgi:predicted SPOUT superfamily RNA methylase MTH1